LTNQFNIAYSLNILWRFLFCIWQLEFEEARKALQAELDNGISIDQLRKKILKGNIESKVSKQLKNKKYFSVERIQRKKRDIMQLLNKHKSDVTEQKVETTPIQPTVLDHFNQSLQEKDGCEVLSRKLFKFGDNEILVRFLESHFIFPNLAFPC
jgi:alpha-glucan, water dikinase